MKLRQIFSTTSKAIVEVLVLCILLFLTASDVVIAILRITYLLFGIRKSWNNGEINRFKSPMIFQDFVGIIYGV